ARLEVGVLKRAAKRTRHFLKIRIGKPHFFAVAIGFNQAGFVRPALQRILERCTQAGILAEIKHSGCYLTTESRRHEKNKSLSERNLIGAMQPEELERAFALFPPLARMLANAMLT